ncbi:hypothetical protein [Rhodanobacter glycinis]|uniref:hypothetical protein n=1 Tax=Rhodanobacter glycinis TaxID=582702 RepID=UPI0011276C23|nr:hypothetical protein [Rhodanobacter glycinis]
MTLSLDRQPAFDVIEGTAFAWLEAVTYQRLWTQSEDQTRVRAAFRWLAANSTSWPNPKLFLDAMPQRVPIAEAKLLEVDPTPEQLAEREASKQRVNAMIGEISRKLRISR